VSGWTIREEMPADVDAIQAVTAAAFADHPHSSGAEPAIVAHLRADGDLALSLVAEEAGHEAIIGHTAFSPARLSTGEEGWYALGPISVRPGRQREGIGRAMIQAGNDRLRALGARGVTLLGDPAYYERVGFRRDTALGIEGPLAPYFHALPFGGEPPAALVSFAPAFRLAALRN
jgi:putative acetyltransferase